MKKIIYLDQFSVSDMLDHTGLPIWREIKKKIVSLHKDGKIFCPLSSEHFIETSQKGQSSAKSHNEFYTSISDGFCLKPELFITSQLISSYIRKNNVTLKTYMYERVGDVFAINENFDNFFGLSTQFRDLLTSAGTDINQLRQATHNQKIDSKTKLTMYSAIKSIQPRYFIQRLQELRNENQLTIKGEMIGKKIIPHWVDLTIEQLLKKHKLNRFEVDKLIFELEQNKFNNIPTLDIKMSLLALMSVYSKKETPGDHIDLMRIATGLPIAEILFTDKKRKNEIQELKLDEKYKTKVFSGMQKDLEECLEELSKL